ncbi:C4-dicarboxylate ABC transporter permease [Desulfocarbo indianensis]|nr:C4-dicarboxylate ABC transporter permease [Desulfocarbo indianensis]
MLSNTLVGVIGIVLLVALFFLRIPVAYVMALVGFAGFAWVRGLDPGLSILARDIYGVFSSYGLTIIPLFIFMGHLAYHAGISRRLYDTAYKFTGSTRGGLAMATICACTAFGAVCGSSPATAATMATVGLPEMRRYGYHPELATGSVASGGSMGMLMPPSVVLIVYGVLTEQSIGRLFMAGVVPAVFITALFIAAIALMCRWRPELGPAGPRHSLLQKMQSLFNLIETLAVFLLVMGGLFLGWFTPTEAGGVGAMGVLLAALARRQISWDGFWRAVVDSLRTSCMVLFLVAGAVIFGHFLAVTGIPMAVAEAISGLDLPGWAVIFLMVLVYLLGGCFIDALALIMLTIPIFYPIVLRLGYDPIWFGVIIVLVTQMGVITPPVGINAYVVKGVDTRTPLETIFKGCLPFLGALLAGTVALVFVPELVLWLPRLMY